ncbi:MAG: ATP synthase subunit C [Oscillospiraceae bacterium]|nr:ATP synthase subunit C [Oscillospiraceae bacterium]
MGIREFVAAFVLVMMILAPLLGIALRHKRGRPVKALLLWQAVSFFALGLILVGAFASGALAAETAESISTEPTGGVTDMGWGMIAAALSTGLAGIGGGIATAAATSAALGAVSENEKSFGKAILFVGLAESISLYGLIVSFMILGKF